MPHMTDKQLAKLSAAANRSKTAMAKAREKAEEKAGEVIAVAEASVAAGAVGFARGKFEKADGSWNIPGTSIDIELAGGLLGVGAAMLDLFGRYDSHVLNMSQGVLAHYVGQISRKWAKTGNLGFVAGDYGSIHGMMPSNVAGELDVGANWDPVSYNPTQISAPYDDAVSMALAQSGV